MADEESHFDSEEVSNEGEVRIMRVALNSESDAIKWVSVFAETTRTEWVKLRTYPEPQRYVFRCQWSCAFSSKNKKGTPTKRNLACPAKMEMLIRLNTTGTRKKDPYLRGDKPKAAIITITGSHNHDIECADTYKMMRGKSNLRGTFYQYFQRGMSPAQAMKLHEQKIMVEERGTELLADAHFNPTKRTVYHWHCLWRKLNRPTKEKPTETLGSFWENFMSTQEMQTPPVLKSEPADVAGPEPCDSAPGSEPSDTPPANGRDKSAPPDNRAQVTNPPSFPPPSPLSSTTSSLPIPEEPSLKKSSKLETLQDAKCREKSNALFAGIVEKCLSLHQMLQNSPGYVKHLETIKERLSSIEDSKDAMNMLARTISAMNTEYRRLGKRKKPQSDEEEQRKKRRKPLESDSEG